MQKAFAKTKAFFYAMRFLSFRTCIAREIIVINHAERLITWIAMR
jgi:hypothetical protein